MLHQETIRIKTRGHRDMQDITAEVARIAAASGVGAAQTRRPAAKHESDRP